MGCKKSKQRMKQLLVNFGRIWNSSEATPKQKAAAADHFGDGPGPANGHSDNSERRPRKMKGVGLLIILFVVLAALAICSYRNKKNAPDATADTVEIEVLNTTSATMVAQVQPACLAEAEHDIE